MRKTVIILLTLVLLLYTGNPGRIFSEPPVVLKEQKILSLNQFITKTCEYDITFREILIDSMKLAYVKDLNLPSRDLVLSLSSQYNLALQENNTGGFKSAISLSALFPSTGTEISGTYSATPNYLLDRKTSSFTAMVSQPIAKNAFGYGNRLEEKITDLSIEVVRYQIVEAYEDYFASLIALYYQWYSDYANVINAEFSLAENKKLLRNIQARKKYSIAFQSDVDKINLQFIEKQENLYTMQNTYRKTEQIIYQAAGYKKTKRLIPRFDAYSEKDIDFNKGYGRFTAQSRTYTILSLLEKKGSLEVKRNAHNLLPSVSLLLGYSRNGTGYLLEESVDSVFAGATFEYSLMRQKEKALHKTSKIEHKKAVLSAENLKRKLERDLKNLYDQIELERKLVDISERKIKLGQRVVRSELKNYRQARASLSDVIVVFNKLESYKYEKVHHTAQLHTLRIEWLRLNDQLVSKNDMKIQ
ncbi:MAG: TolC family protein [bacterium]|nr:TolC family protein [bacterium]